jgi:DNA-binding NarL/FixJ family response regulator
MVTLQEDVQVIGLSCRQLTVIDRLSTGRPVKSVAADLNMTVASVNNDIQRAIHALDAGNTAGLVATALRKGWIR